MSTDLALRIAAISFMVWVWWWPQANASRVGDAWRSFCEKHLIADDPHQFEDVSNEALVRYFLESGTEGARQEILRRLTDGRMEK